MANHKGIFSGTVRIALVALLVLVPSSLAAPRQSSSSVCSPTCKTSHDAKLRYEGGKSYTYNFESESITQVTGSTSENSKLKVKGQLVLEATSQCDFVLTIKDASIQDPNGQQVPNMDALRGSSLRFAYQDGTVEEVCIDESDPTWSANIKRGLVSMLQNQGLKSMGKSVIVEADVNGRCPTNYIVQGDRYIKSRDLLGCSHREDSKLLHHGIRYDVPSRTKSLPIASSNLTCVQDMKKGVVNTVSCKETHLLNAFSEGQMGAQTTVVSTLSLESVESSRRSSASAGSYKPSSIFYDHADTLQKKESKNAAVLTRAILTKVCSEMDASTFSADAPEYFLQLKKAIENIREQDLKEIHNSLDAGRICATNSKTLKKMLVDAIVQAGSDASVAFVANMYQDLEGSAQKSFFRQLAFSPRPGPSALAAVTQLLKSQKLNAELLLAASGLAHQYCSNYNQECAEVPEYSALVSLIARQASQKCMSSDEAEIEQGIAALQALGNLDALTSDAVAAIKRCMAGSERVQIRALDAFRRDACNPSLKSHAHHVFADKHEPSNVRIQAYIAVSNCLESSDVQKIQKVLEQEESDQVLSYVASHIRNKIRSSKPDVSEAFNHLGQVRYPRSAPQDIFKYSKNYEQSYMSRRNDVGGSLDGNLIYSAKSYVPRSLTANATIYAMGRSLNILEVGLYAENLERALEKMIKAKNSGKSSHSRYVWGGKSDYMLKSAGSSSSGEFTPLYNVDEQMESFYPVAAVNTRSGQQQGYGDVYVRILGTTMMVSTLHEDKLEIPNVWNNKPVLRDTKSGNNIRMTENIALFDEELVYPTISGMPIKYGLAASGSVDLEMSTVAGKSGFFNQDASFQARIIPRCAMLLRGRMATALGNVESGLQLEGKVHSTSGMDVAVTNEKNKFDFKLSFPQEKPSLLEARSDLYWIHAQEDKAESKRTVSTNAQQNIYAKSSRPQDCYEAAILGLRFCADVAVPMTRGSGPLAPLRGPMIAGVHIQKADPGMQGYHVLVESQLEGRKQYINALIDTPGSRINQKVQVKASLEREDVLKAALEVQSPWKNFELEYNQEYNEERKSAKLALNLDRDQYAALAQLETTGTQNKKTYKPTISYTSPYKTYEILSGNVEYRPGQKVVAEIQTDAGNYRMLNGKLQVTTEYEYQSKDVYHYTNDITFDFPAWGLGIVNHKSSFKHNKPDFELRLTHSFMETGEKGTSYWKLTYVPEQRWEVHTTSDCSYFNFANFKLDWTATRNKQNGEITNNFLFNHQQGYKNKPVTIKTASRFTKTARNGFDIVNQFTATAENLDVQLQLNGKHDVDRSHEYELRAYSGNSHKLDFKLTSGPEVFFNYNLQASLKYPGQYYELSEIAKQVNDYTWSYDTQFVARPGNTYDVTAELVNKDERSDVEKSFSATIKSDKWDAPQVFKTGLKKESVGITAYAQYDSEGESEINVVTSYKQIGLQPDNVKMVVFVRKYIDARIQGSRSPSTTNTKIVGKWIPTDRVVKMEAEYKNQGDKWSMDGQVQWDADRDSSKQARLSSKTTYTSSYSLESKNELIFEDQAHNFDYIIKKGRSLMDGEHLVDAIYRGPKDAKLKVYVQHIGETRPRSTSSKIVGKVQFMRDFPYEIEWENRWANFDKKQMTFEVLTDLKAVSAGNTKLQVVGEAKSLYPPGSVRTFTGNFGVSGSIIPTTMSLKYDTEYRGTALKARVEGKYGSKAASIDVGGKLDRYSPKKTVELEYNVKMPIYPKSISGKQYYSYVYDSLSHMEISESGSIRIGNEQPTSWSHIIHHISNEFKVESKVTKRGNDLWDLEVSGRRDRRRTVVDFVGMVKDHGIKFYSNVDGKFPYYNIRSNASIDMPRSRSNNKEWSYFLNHKTSQNGQVIETDLTLVRSGDKFVLSNKLENYGKRKSIDMAFTDGSVPRKMYVMFMNQEPKYTLESYVKWGESGKFLDTKGTIEKSSDLVEMTVQLNGPSLKIDKINARATQKSSNGRLALDVNVQEKNQQLLKLILDYGKTTKRSADIYDGSVKFAGRKSRYAGSFRVEKVEFSKQRDGEQGSMIQGGVSFQGHDEPMKFNVSMKNTDMQKQITITLCSHGDKQCRSGDLYYTKEVEGRDESYEFRATHSTVRGQRSSVDGFNVKSRQSGDEYTHEANFITNEQKENPMGYRMTKKADREYGLDINLPERVISAVLVRDSRPGHEQAEVSIWLNKLRKSHDKLSMILSYDVLRESSEGAKGYAVAYELKHHELPQNMKVNAKVIYGGRNTILDVATEAALFRQGSKLAWTAQITRDDAGKRNGIIYKLKSAIVARQPMIEAQLKGEFHDTEEEKVVSVQTQYKDQDVRHGTESKVLAFYNSQSAQFKVTLDDETPISWTTTWSQPSKHSNSVYDVRHEILLPGMSDSQKVEMHLHTANLPHATLKIYKKDSKSGDYLQAFVGFQSDLEFGVGMYRKEQGIRETLGDFNVALNSSRLLSVKLDWDVRNMKNAMSSARKQLNYANQQFKETLRETVDESAKKVETLFDRLTDAMPDFTPVMEVYKKELNTIKKELKKSDEAKMIIEYVEAMETVLDDYFHWVNDVVEFFAETFVAIGDKIAEVIRALPRTLGNLRELVPEWYDAVQEYFDELMHNLRAMAKSIAEEIEHIMKKLPNGHKMWDALYDTTKGVGKATKFAMDMTVDTVAGLTKQIMELGSAIFENTEVKDYMMQLLSRYERIVAKIIDEIKERTDRLRENLLSRFANEEAQEFILAVYNYATKKVQGVRVNDSAAQKDIYEKFIRAIKRAADDMWTVDTRNGLIVAQIPLPTPIGSLKDVDQYLPKVSFDYFGKDFLGQTVDTLNSFVKHSDRYVATEVNHLLKLQLASPLSSYALLIGSEYVRTFDGKFFDMHGKGHCRYVLASDFDSHSRNFTIAVEYDEDNNEPRKRVIINYGDFQSVITPDYRVKVRKISDTPYTEGELVAQEAMDHVTVRSTDDNLSVTCDKQHDVCIFSLSKIYHGKTKGLFGNFNNEQHDDFHSPAGNVLNKLGSFIQSWKMDPTCQENPIRRNQQQKLRASTGRCAQAFQLDNSPLNKCFEAVNPLDFQKICEEMEVNQSTSRMGNILGVEPVCVVSTAYAQACAKNYKYIPLMTGC